MSAMHPSRSWRGCALCKPHKRRGLGTRHKIPASELRRAGGRRAVKRGDWS